AKALADVRAQAQAFARAPSERDRAGGRAAERTAVVAARGHFAVERAPGRTPAREERTIVATVAVARNVGERVAHLGFVAHEIDPGADARPIVEAEFVLPQQAGTARKVVRAEHRRLEVLAVVAECEPVVPTLAEFAFEV